MTLISIPTEQTTAATDLALALVSAVICYLTLKAGKSSKPKKGRIWAWAFGLLAFAALTGSIAHGFQMSKELNYILWQPLNLSLGLTVSLFVVGVVFDLTNGSLPRFILPTMLVIGTFFFLITLFFPGSFLVFILYEAVAMLFSLTVYVVLARRHRLKGAAVMATGILITIVAAAIQASETIHLRIIWEFDHNGLFHLVQVAGLVTLWFGLRLDLVKGSGIEVRANTSNG